MTDCSKPLGFSEFPANNVKMEDLDMDTRSTPIETQILFSLPWDLNRQPFIFSLKTSEPHRWQLTTAFNALQRLINGLHTQC